MDNKINIKKKRNILFLVHTEYHMIVTLSVISDRYNDPELFKIYICQTEISTSNRFKVPKNIDLLSHVEYYTLKYEERDFTFNKQLHETVKDILDRKIDTFVLFNHHGFLPIFLAKKLSKKGCKICLAPDGAKAYNTIKRIAPRWSIKAAINLQRFLLSNNLYLNCIHIPTLPYANLPEIDEVWIQYIKGYENARNKTLVKIDILKSTLSLKVNNNFFGFNYSKELSLNNKILFYINQPVKNSAIYDYEIELLMYLRRRFEDHKLIIKLHPLTEKSQIERYNLLSNTQLITKTFPAEMYIAQLKDSLILSFWSTACLINNPQVRTYWLHPILERKAIMPDYIKIYNPSDHIVEVDHAENIE